MFAQKHRYCVDLKEEYPVIRESVFKCSDRVYVIRKQRHKGTNKESQYRRFEVEKYFPKKKNTIQ